jgi:siroheme synthase/uroporphyrinogen-III synthase
LSTPETGRVYLVGAGPGDPGLLTARALELIAQADVILFDRLIPTEALEGAHADVELLFVGKEGGGPSVPQERTEALMVQRAQEGRTVVRLKGGDPFVFGRGGEEALALRAAGIPFEVVPGVTAGVAAPAYAGIPVTHRGLSTAVALITGHRADPPDSEGDSDVGGSQDPGKPAEGGGVGGSRDPAEGGGESGGGDPEEGAESASEGGDEDGSGRPGDLEERAKGASEGGDEDGSGRPGDPDEQTEGAGGETDLDWPALAAFPGMLVFYMGVRQLPHITTSLIAAGRPASEPVAVVERGTLPDQRTVTGTLATIAERAREEQVRAPSITVVGPVTALADELAWRAPLPLGGRSVAVTRARAQASGLAQRLRKLGAHVVQAPVIRTRPLGGPPLDPTPYDLICLTSPTGVDCLFERIAAAGLDTRALARTHVAAIGPSTARALAAHGIAADIVPERFVAESLVEALAELPIRRALVARASEARDVLPNALSARGVEVSVLALYETIAEPLSPWSLTAAREADYITFTSSSTVRFFLEAAGGAGAISPHTRIVSIGPVTSATLREHGLEPHVLARRHDIEGVVEALLADAASTPADRR